MALAPHISCIYPNVAYVSSHCSKAWKQEKILQQGLADSGWTSGGFRPHEQVRICLKESQSILSGQGVGG
jgi:hypothetical protein